MRRYRLWDLYGDDLPAELGLGGLVLFGGQGFDGLSSDLWFLLDPTQWLGTRLWDDTAALYLLEPQGFAANGAHL